MSSLQAPRARNPALGETAEAETTRLYELHGERVHAFCLGRLGDREEAADAVQDTFAKAWMALRDGCEVRQPLAWLLTIAGNVCASRYRARRARPIETPLHDDAEAAVSHQPPAELAGLPTALRALPDEQRRAFVLRELRGCSYEEIGYDLGVSYSSVAALLHRSRRAVAASLSGAGRRVLVIVPLPGFIKAWFEGGAVSATMVATTAGAVLLFSPQLGSAPAHNRPLPATPARSAALSPLGIDPRVFFMLRLPGAAPWSREAVFNPWTWRVASSPSTGAERILAPGGGSTVGADWKHGVPAAPETDGASQLQPVTDSQSPNSATDPSPAASVVDLQSPASAAGTPSGGGQPASTGSQSTGSQSTGSQSTGPKSTGPKSSGPKSSGPKSSGPKSSGPKSSGPKSSGPQSSGSQSSGSQSSGPQSSGPQSSGPQSSGPKSSGPQSSGPQSSGPQSSGPQSSGPQSSGPQSSGPQSSGPQSSGPQSSGPQSTGPPTDPGTQGDTPEQ